MFKIKKVQVKTEDEFGGRIVEIETTKGNIRTPERVVTSTEAGYKSQVGCDDAYANKIFEIIGIYNEDSVKRLYSKNGNFGERKRNINAKVRQFEDAITKYYIQPQWSRRDLVFTDKDLKFLVELEMQSKVDMVALPDSSINTKPEVFEKNMLSLAKLVRSDNEAGEPVPVLDMATEPDIFKQKFKTILDNNGTFSVVNIVGRSMEAYAPNYGTVWDNRDKDIWIIASGVNRFLQRDWTTAQMHLLLRHGVDTCARLTQQVPIEIQPKDIENIKRFDAQTLGILKLREHERRYGNELNCECTACEDKNLDEFIREYKVNQMGTTSSLNLETWCKIHEVFSGTEEFNILREYIKKGESTEYWGKKEYSRKYFSL